MAADLRSTEEEVRVIVGLAGATRQHHEMHQALGALAALGPEAAIAEPAIQALLALPDRTEQPDQRVLFDPLGQIRRAARHALRRIHAKKP